MRGDPGALGEREPADDTQLRVEPLPGPESGRIGARSLKLIGRAITARPRLARTLSAGALVTLLIALTMVVWRPPLNALLAPVITPTSTATPRQFGAPEIPPGTGWQPAGPSAAQHIAFAPSDSSIAYTCAAPGLTALDDPVPIILDVSRDHGATWQSLTTPARGVWCDLTVNPADALDVTLVSIPSTPGQTSPPPGALAFSRSFDGGVTWRPWPLPADPGGSAAPVTWYQWAWAGGTLFVTPFVAGEQDYTRLAASAAGQPFTWVHQNGLFAGTPAEARINGLIGSSTSLFVDLISQYQTCPPDCRLMMRTLDGGASWSRFTGQYLGQPVYLDQNQVTAGASPSIFGAIVDPTDPTGESRTYVHAEDGGFSWRPLAAPPNHLLITQIAQVPDGTLYAELYPFPGTRLDAAAPGVYALVPKADSWRFVAPYPHSRGGIAVSWNKQGHALALWASLPSARSNFPRIGLETHAP